MRCLNFHQKKYDITKLLDGDGLCLDVGGNHIPHLIFDYVLTTHQFFPSEYFNKNIPKDKQPIRNKVRELSNQGWGYTKIHKYLLKNGYEVSKHRTSIDCMIKKMKKKHPFCSTCKNHHPQHYDGFDYLDCML